MEIAFVVGLGCLTACRPVSEHADGVTLVASSAAPVPGMSFELRFDEDMARSEEIGEAVTNSPLVATPPVRGTFTWINRRQGIFTPTEPLAMDTRYELSLRPNFARADGRPSRAVLRQIVATPPLELVAAWPRKGNTNAPSDPEIKLIFNSDVPAAKAGAYLIFRSLEGRQVPADLRQGTGAEFPSRYDEGNLSRESLLSWGQQFLEAQPEHPPMVWVDGESDATNEVGNLLIATPRYPLPLGAGWKLMLARGLPAVDGRLRLAHGAEVVVGDVTPFTVANPVVRNILSAGPSVELAFSKQVAETLTNKWREWITVDPAPTNLDARISGRTITLTGEFKSKSNYLIHLRAGLPAEEPFSLAVTKDFAVLVPPIPPRLYFPAFGRDQLAEGKRVFPLLVVNVPQVRVRAKLLEPHAVVHALQGYQQGYFRTWKDRRATGLEDEPFRAVSYELVPGRTIFDQTLEGTHGTDQPDQIDLSWDRILAGRKAGVVFLEAARQSDNYWEDPALGAQALVQVTDLGMLWKGAGSNVDVFVFSYRTGQPVEGAVARLYGSENEVISEALTDASGSARLTTATNAAWIGTQKGDDLHLLDLDRHRIGLYGFRLPFAWRSEEVDRRVMLFSDRNLYRPGETVHLKAIVRDWTGGGLNVPANLTGRVECVDSRQQIFFATNVALNALGSWSDSVKLTAPPLGQYMARLRIGGEDYNHWFEVREFQPSAFEIALPFKPEYGPDEPIEVPLSARYFFGKELARAQVKWSMQAADAEFKAEPFRGFAFHRCDFEARLGRGASSIALAGQGTLTAGSNFIIAPRLTINSVTPRPRSVSLLAEVTDLNQQTLSRSVEFLRHSSEFYLGLRQSASVVPAGKELPIEILAAGAGGQPWPESVKVQVSLKHIEWVSTRLQGAGRSVRYHTEPVLTNVTERQIEVAPIKLPTGPADVVKGQAIGGLVPSGAGDYLVEVSATDPGGRSVVSSVFFSVCAPDERGWDYRNNVQLTLKTDRPRYKPGETAEILAEAPYSGLAMVTVERDRVLRSFVARLEGNAPSVRVPITAGDTPNVFVSVMLLRGAENCPRAVKEPEYRVGYCQIMVDDPSTRLQVAVSPLATNCLPGQQMEMNVQVQDSQGQAAPAAEVTLFAVDEGILSLMESPVPDPYAFFYAARPLAVRTHFSLPHLLPEDPAQLRFENKGYLGGGGGKNRVRKNFLACAFWSATLVTDASGRATARFPAPDSLTRYRVMAVVQTARSQFGMGQAAFQVSKPLIVEPALPRFATITDRLAARAVVQNQTSREGIVAVALALDSKAKSSDGVLERRVSVPANGTAVVEFPLEMTDVGLAQWTWSVRFVEEGPEGFRDAVQSTLEVGHLVPVRRQIVLTRTADPGVNLLAGADADLLAGRGTVSISLANSRLNELGETVSQLLHYPYGCAEQTASSLLPWIVLREAQAFRPKSRTFTNDWDTAIRAGVNRLFAMQTFGGGLGYWPGDREPMFWASAYGGLVLALAQRQGMPVPRNDFDSLVKYLRNELQRTPLEQANLSDCVLAFYALAAAGQSEPPYHERLYSLRHRLAREDRALLALAILESAQAEENTAAPNSPRTALAGVPDPRLKANPRLSPAQDDMVRELLRAEATGGNRNSVAFGSPARDLAVRLLAWSRYRPEGPAVDALVADLMRDQQQGHWGSTQSDAWALLALTEYARRVESERPAVRGRLIWAGQAQPFEIGGLTNCVMASFPFTNASLDSLKLVNDSGGQLFATLTLEARSPATRLTRQDRGFSLQREYQRIDDDNQLQEPKDLRVGDRVLVSLRLDVRDPARYVVIDDALPCLLEAVQPGFKTQGIRPGITLPFQAEDWPASFREIRKDRFLTFANIVPPGHYVVRYVARVRAVGDVTAPPAKAEEMYHPERCGFTETRALSSHGWD